MFGERIWERKFPLVCVRGGFVVFWVERWGNLCMGARHATCRVLFHLPHVLFFQMKWVAVVLACLFLLQGGYIQLPPFTIPPWTIDRPRPLIPPSHLTLHVCMYAVWRLIISALAPLENDFLHHCHGQIMNSSPQKILQRLWSIIYRMRIFSLKMAGVEPLKA